MDPLISVENLTKKFGEIAALKNINLSLPKGEFIGLVGPDGAGKTTLIRLIAGLMLPTSGKITVAGFNTVTQAESIHEILGYMPQRFGLYEDLTVMQNLVLYAELNNVVGAERQKAFEKLLKFTDLGPFTKRLAGALSGGMKQKLGLACTLIRKPRLLLLDEPSVGVDPISRRELWKMVHELTSEGISIIWSTAYLDEAAKCDKVILLNLGEVLYFGDPKGLTDRVEGRTFTTHNHNRPLLAELVNRDDIIDATIQGSLIRIVTKKPEPLENYTPVAPRFEDGFIDILGGLPKGASKLAESFPAIPKKEEPIIVAHELTKKFNSFVAADSLTFEIKRGEVFGLLGPNGAGKSTTFKMLCGLLKPTSGTGIVNGKSLLTAPGAARSHIGYMAQKFSLYGELSVLQNLRFFAGVYSAKPESIGQMIDIFDFQPLLNLNAKDLPLGFKQRLALSCAVMHHPEILFLDEPTSGVDPITRREFWNHINGLVGKGITVVITTHFMDEAEYCDRIGLIHQGKIITIGTPDSLKESAKTEMNPNPTLEDAFIHLIEQPHAS